MPQGRGPVHPTRVTLNRHRPDRNPAVQRSPFSHCDVVSLGWRHRSLPTAPIPHQSLGRKALFDVRRREFIKVLGGAAATWPLAARAQQGERMRRIGIILPAAADDAEFQTWVEAFLQALAQLGWVIGRNVRIDTRWATTNSANIRRHAAELAALATGRHPGLWHLDRGADAAGDTHRADRVPDRRRSGRLRLRRQPGAARRQRHGLSHVRIQLERQMAGAAQRDRAGRDASCGSAGSRHTVRHRPVRRDPGRGAVA